MWRVGAISSQQSAFTGEWVVYKVEKSYVQALWDRLVNGCNSIASLLLRSPIEIQSGCETEENATP